MRQSLSFRNRTAAVIAVAACALAVLPLPASAQHAPWLVLPGPGNGYVNVPHHEDLSPADAITIELWVYLVTGRAWDDHEMAVLVGKNMNSGYWFGFSERKLRFHPTGILAYQDSDGTIPIREWAHVAVTYDGEELRFYLNGSLDTTFTDFSHAIASSDAPLRIGGDSYLGRTPFGAMDEVRLWNVVRTESEIADNMNTVIDTATEGLVAAWNFDDDTTDPIGGHDGTLEGSAELGSEVPELDTCPNEYFVPAAAHIRGELDSQWRSDVTIFNPTRDDATVVLYLLERDQDNFEAESTEVVVTERTAVALPDVVLEKFGKSGLAAALRLCSDQPLRIRTRTYNLSDDGTFGQGIPGFSVLEATRQGHLIALYENDQFRTNVGFVNTSPNPTTVYLDFFDGQGLQIGSTSHEMKPYGHIQVGRAYREVTEDPIENGWIEFVAPSADVIGYASMADNVTSDGTYLAAN
jgi:hypothetical protein